jgi:hypothetical protein
MSTENIKKKFLGFKLRAVREAGILTAIYEPLV